MGEDVQKIFLVAVSVRRNRPLEVSHLKKNDSGIRRRADRHNDITTVTLYVSLLTLLRMSISLA